MSWVQRGLILVALPLLMVACSSGPDELAQWTENERRTAKATVKPLQPPSKFEPQAYEMLGGVDPFSTQKLSVAARQEAAQPNSLLTAEMNRRREPLEAYPLDSMEMVGSMSRRDGQYAILRVDNLLYHVKRGDYLGQNFGRVTKVDETQLTLREIVQDAANEWVERITTLQMQEAAR